MSIHIPIKDSLSLLNVIKGCWFEYIEIINKLPDRSPFCNNFPLVVLFRLIHINSLNLLKLNVLLRVENYWAMFCQL